MLFDAELMQVAQFLKQLKKQKTAKSKITQIARECSQALGDRFSGLLTTASHISFADKRIKPNNVYI